MVGAFAAVVVSPGWWVAVVELVPAAWRPYVGRSTNSSVLDLLFGSTLRHHAGGLIAFLVGLGLTSGSLWVLHQVSPDPNRGVEVAILVVANAISTLVRFVALRQLMAHHR